MSILYKDIYVVWNYEEGSPGSPPQPAYCIDEAVTYTSVDTKYVYIGPEDIPPYSSTNVEPGYYAIHVPGETVTTTKTTCYPGSPGEPSTPSRAYYTTDYNIGWSGAAISAAAFSGDQEFWFSLPTQNVGAVVGLNSGPNEGANYLEIEWAVYANGVDWQIVENGELKPAKGTHVATDVFRIQRLGDTIRYFKNSALVYTSYKRPPLSDLFADASLYMGGDQVVDAAFYAIDAGTTDDVTGGLGEGPTAEGYTYKGTIPDSTHLGSIPYPDDGDLWVAVDDFTAWVYDSGTSQWDPVTTYTYNTYSDVPAASTYPAGTVVIVLDTGNIYVTDGTSTWSYIGTLTPPAVPENDPDAIHGKYGDGTGALGPLYGYSTADSYGDVIVDVDTGANDPTNAADNGYGGGSGGPNATPDGDWVGRQGGELRGLVAWAGAELDASVGEDATGSDPTIPYLDGEYYGRAGSELRQLVGHAYGGPGLGDYSTATGYLDVLVGDSIAHTGAQGPYLELTPQYSLTSGYLQNVQGFVLSLSGEASTAEGLLAQLQGYSEANSYATGGSVVSDNTQDPATGEDGGSGGPNATTDGDWAGRSGGQLRGLVGFGVDNSWYDALDGVAILWMSDSYYMLGMGRVGQAPETPNNQVIYTLSGYGWDSWGHNTYSGSLSGYALDAQGRLANFGGLTADLPAVTLDASGHVSTNGTAQLTLRTKYSGQAQGHGYLVAKLAKLTLTTAAGTVPWTGSLVEKLPRLSISASGSIAEWGSVEGTLSQLVGGNTGWTNGWLPGLIGDGYGYEVVAITYEGYSVTLRWGEGFYVANTTHLTDQPFDRYVRFKDKYLGVKADGLFEIGGSTFDTSPIVSVCKTVSSALGDPRRKRTRSVYIGGEVGTDMEMTVTSDEVTEAEYVYTQKIRPGARKHRFVLGRGMTGTYISYQFSNRNGEPFRIDDFTPEVDVMSRKI